MDILRPFYGWKPELKPAVHDLEERVKQAIFWREVKGVRVFHESDPVLLLQELWGSYHGSSATGRPPRSSELLDWGSFLEAFRGSNLDSFDYTLWPWNLLRDTHWYSLYNPCGYIFGGMPLYAAKFKPLLELSLAGNFLHGFNEEDNLLVLVAD